MGKEPNDDAHGQLGCRDEIEGIPHRSGRGQHVDEPENHSHGPDEPCQLRKAFAHWLFRLHMTRIAGVDQLLCS